MISITKPERVLCETNVIIDVLEFTLEEMHHINFDWFRPINCHRQTPGQLKEWCSEVGLSIEHMDMHEAGITIVTKKTEQQK